MLKAAIKKKGIKGILIICLALLIGGCVQSVKNSRFSSEKNSTAYTIANSKQVFAAKVIRDGKNRFELSSDQHILSKESSEALKALFLNQKGYVFGKTKKCLFTPEIAFYFDGSIKNVVLVNVFNSQIKFVEGEKSAIFDYDPMAGELNGLCRKILEKLGETHS